MIRDEIYIENYMRIIDESIETKVLRIIRDESIENYMRII